MKIGFFELEGWEESLIKERFRGHQIFLSPDKIDADHLPADLTFDIVSTFVNSRLPKEVVEKFTGLKLVSTRSTGFDHIDAATVRERGGEVAYVPGYGDNTVAEYAMSLLLNLTRKTYQAIDQVKENGSFSLVGLRGVDLKGKTLGVIGTGRIGKEMIKIAQGFSMKVVAFDAFPDASYAAANNFTYASLEDLLSSADAISIHCPLNDSTKHLINLENLSKIKPGMYLVNTARGPIMETAAIVEGIQKGVFAGVATDVLEEEGEMHDELNHLASGHPKEEELRVLLANHILMHLPNVLITPHNAFNSREALNRILDTTLNNISSFIEGKPTNLVPR